MGTPKFMEAGAAPSTVETRTTGKPHRFRQGEPCQQLPAPLPRASTPPRPGLLGDGGRRHGVREATDGRLRHLWELLIPPILTSCYISAQVISLPAPDF